MYTDLTKMPMARIETYGRNGQIRQCALVVYGFKRHSNQVMFSGLRDLSQLGAPFKKKKN